MKPAPAPAPAGGAGGITAWPCRMPSMDAGVCWKGMGARSHAETTKEVRTSCGLQVGTRRFPFWPRSPSSSGQAEAGAFFCCHQNLPLREMPSRTFRWLAFLLSWVTHRKAHTHARDRRVREREGDPSMAPAGMVGRSPVSHRFTI
jgi:hypothetical protein